MAQPFSCQYCWESTEIRILHDADIGQGGFGAADSPIHQLTVLREAGCDMIIPRDAGRDQGGWNVADGPTFQLAVLLRTYGKGDST